MLVFRIFSLTRQIFFYLGVILSTIVSISSEAVPASSEGERPLPNPAILVWFSRCDFFCIWGRKIRCNPNFSKLSDERHLLDKRVDFSQLLWQKGDKVAQTTRLYDRLYLDNLDVMKSYNLQPNSIKQLYNLMTS